MTKFELRCPHCVISELIIAHVPEEMYSIQELVSSVVEVALDMISAAEPHEQEAVATAAAAFLMEGICDIQAGRYKTGRPNIHDTQGNA
jgi:hypothetical protein